MLLSPKGLDLTICLENSAPKSRTLRPHLLVASGGPDAAEETRPARQALRHRRVWFGLGTGGKRCVTFVARRP